MSIDQEAEVRPLPTADWFDPAEARRDPYPSYSRLRRESPVAWIPSVRRVFFSSYEAVSFGERNPDVFSAAVDDALVDRALGARPLLRKDGEEHSSERQGFNSVLRPRRIMEQWSEAFQKNAAHYLDVLEGSGPGGAELNRDFARPLAAKNLADMLGFREAEPEDVARWSADYVAGMGNLLDDQEIWQRCERTRAEVNATLDELIPFLRSHPDASLISALIHSGMSESSVRANVGLTISGGMNEPQHICTAEVFYLSQGTEPVDTEQLAEAEWTAVFDEAARLNSPIGLVARQSVSDCVVDGTLVPAGSAVSLVFASANRDDAQFVRPDEFDLTRPKRRQLAFGAGVHACAGRWAAEESIGRTAVPALYRRFRGFRTDDDRGVEWDGLVFRGLRRLPVTWDGVN